MRKHNQRWTSPRRARPQAGPITGPWSTSQQNITIPNSSILRLAVAGKVRVHNAQNRRSFRWEDSPAGQIQLTLNS